MAEKDEKAVKAVAKKDKKPEKKSDDGKPNPIRQLIDFVGDVRRELKKVSWPTRADTMTSTWVIISFTFLMSVFLFLCDTVVHFLMQLAFA